MSFVLNKGLRLFASRLGRILLFFILFWGFSAILLFTHLLFLKQNIQQQEYENVHSALDEYIHLRKTLTAKHLSIHSTPQELDFIRVTRGRDQFLITGRKHFHFKGLVDLPPSATGMWVDLHHPEQEGSWILVSFPLAENSFVQGGKDISNSGLSIYLLAKSTSIRMFLLSALGCLSLSFLVVYVMEQPLRRLRNTIQTALLDKSFTLPETQDILTPLYTLWETIFYQNRKLISEIQSSLDNVAHDLRTPMTRLRAVAEYALQSDLRDPQPYRNALSDCLEESERVLSMLGVMMSVAEAEAGTMRLELKDTNIAATLEDVIGLYQYVAEEAQITVSLTASKQLIVQADKTRLSQVWANLLDNAIKYGHESGVVDIKAQQQTDMVIISFSDDGMGISESEIGRIWERLYRGDRSRNTQGLGLGLNYVKAVIEAHGGTITVKSTVRKGACFTISLPLQKKIADERRMI